MNRFQSRFAISSALLALGAALTLPLSATAQDYQGGGYPQGRTVCHDVQVPDSSDHSHVAGTAIGAIAGGLLGHTIGHGGGRTLATVGGAVAGGYVGNRVQANNQSQHYHIERRCHQE
jgi:uncharacterized protein YcfJ